MYWKEYQLTLKELQRSSWIWPRRDLQLFAVADSTPRRRREAASVPRSCFSASFIAPIRVSIIACRLSVTDAILSPAKRPFYIVSADFGACYYTNHTYVESGNTRNKQILKKLGQFIVHHNE